MANPRSMPIIAPGVWCAAVPCNCAPSFRGIIIGTADGLWNANQLFHELLLEQGYAHEFEVVEGVAHNIGALYEAVGVEGLVFHAREGGWR